MPGKIDRYVWTVVDVQILLFDIACESLSPTCDTWLKRLQDWTGVILAGGRPLPLRLRKKRMLLPSP